MMALILLVEDDENLRALIQEFLESKHHRVIVATDGAQAFAMAEEHSPHLIITDIVMPGVYGTAAIRKLRDYWRTAKIPIIIMSGSVDQVALGDILKKPNLRFMKKPLKLTDLEATIRELLPEGGYTK